MNRTEILEEAGRIVTRDRAATHGDAEDNFTNIAAIWSTRLGVKISPAQVAILMTDLKTVRAWGNPGHPDNWVDMAGYAACGGEIAMRSAFDFGMTSGPDNKQDQAASVVDWSKIPPEYGWVSRDGDGTEWAHFHEPRRSATGWFYSHSLQKALRPIKVKMNFEGDWKDSLFRRPEGV